LIFNPNLESNDVFLTALGGILSIGLRSLGKVLGALFGGKLARADPITNKWMGVALLPQAGVAIGMALVAGNYSALFSTCFRNQLLAHRFHQAQHLVKTIRIGMLEPFE
jgi:hypothetical protein